MPDLEPTHTSNRSGGVDISGQSTTIGGDVVGRDKIVSMTANVTETPR